MKVVIIGAGHAGVQAASSLREEGFAGEIVLVAEERYLPYQKPPLSKGYLQGKQSAEAILFRSENYYSANQIELRLGTKISQILPNEQEIITSEGEKIEYTHLILATGASNRQLKITGADTAEIFYLRTLADARKIEEKLHNAKNVAIIGGGFIGLELAALAQEKGKNVSVIEAQSRLMERVLPAVISDVFKDTHLQNGVDILLNTFTSSIEGNTIKTQCGKSIKADLILAGIGVIPETKLAEQAGINCENGIVVNEFQQTSIVNIYAIGDCANHYNVFAKRNIRLESVQNAVDQAKVAANHIIGKAEAYQAVPWFWTNQYHLKLQMAGISTGFDEYMVRGDISSGKFSVYYFKDTKLIAVDSLNKAAEHLNARKLLSLGVSPSKEEILDVSFNLNSLV
ncbi:FAD-dependent pyridine nucleotide-disulfide oxidoreductase [Emticicia oligotrophica DSM 17448]|uniref:FAD-dependent pyridine nucleotide-disulfide oxidoreductase n=1 Tax=Emticicia oligotrophica (strain DSM 17448 / CIP 109782 / MTCC 6937 / GPTSA100-15) TaxID=929562 RepID=A0ABN4APX8_EMTOG|nr:FAD-dependent oxidoreductase [Emticicia oligotrophica]AFK04382.1 FAD-dependent pyridine nucleotide-disulfide oxidoreductase [Emticicia oligotrophica DSM 17448]